MMRDAPRVLDVRDLSITLETDHGPAEAVSGVSFGLWPGEALGLVGESGCGKSLTALSLLGLLPPVGYVSGGVAMLGETDLLALDERGFRGVRGCRVALIFQEPMTALNPVLTVGEQVAEVLRAHEGLGRRAAWDAAVARLEEVGIPAPAQRARDYPHQLSGGMRQRVLIASALAGQPEVLLADEPTTALDVTVQAQILDLLQSVLDSARVGLLFISHDLGVVAQICRRVLVMYAGRIVETGPVWPILESPRHPYTRSLLDCVPARGAAGSGPARRLPEIPGQVPPVGRLPEGCAFSDRCPRVTPECRAAEPPLDPVGEARSVRCIHPHGAEKGALA